MDYYKITILLAVLLAVDCAEGVLTKKSAEVDLKLKTKSKHAQDRISSFPGKFGLPKFGFDSLEHLYRPKKFAPRIELSNLNSLPYPSVNLFRKPSFPHPSFTSGPRFQGFNGWRTGFKTPHAIPVSLEAYGPPNRPALPSFSPGSSSFQAHGFPQQNGFFEPNQNNAHAPPTQPDIKYDGWQPIAGNVAAPSDNIQQPVFHDSNAAVPSFDTNVPPYPDSGNLLPPNYQENPQPFHDTGSAPTNNNNLEFASAPSDSYGEPIFNPEDHNLKQSVRVRDESALPPQPLPEQEPFHVLIEPETNIQSFGNPHEQFKHSQGPVGPVEPQGPAPGPGPQGPYPQEDSYLSPPPSSFAADGPYPASRKPFSAPPGPEFGFIRTPNFRGPSRPPSQPPMLFPVSLTPPRTWAPVQFRQSDFQGSNYAASEFTENYSIPSVSLPLENCNDKPHNHLDSEVSMSYNQIVVSEDSRANKISSDPGNNYGLDDTNKVEGSADYSQSEPVNHQISGNDDGYQVQGSKGVYTLQIQPADGSHGTEDSDGSIKHEQVLSDGLLQNILAAIEQPGGVNDFDLSAAPSLSSASVLSAGDQLSDTIPLTDKSEQAIFSNDSHTQ